MGLYSSTWAGRWWSDPWSAHSGLGSTSGPEGAPGTPKAELLGVGNISFTWHG